MALGDSGPHGPRDGVDDTDDAAPVKSNPALSLARGLRFLESVVFCCLAAVVILWAFDRSRDLNFDPITVAVCEGPACTPPSTAVGESVWAQYSATLDLSELTVFSSANTCAFAADVLRTRATDDSAAQTLDFMQSRGTILVTQTGDGTAIIAPGRNNDGLGDVARDAFRWQGPRGCHPMRYAPVFWPLWTIWMFIVSWRAFRYRQSVWAAR